MASRKAATRNEVKQRRVVRCTAARDRKQMHPCRLAMINIIHCQLERHSVEILLQATGAPILTRAPLLKGAPTH